MHANDLLGSVGRRCDLGDGNRRSVGSEDAIGRCRGVHGFEDAQFEVGALGGGFDDEVGVGHALIHRGAGADAAQCGLLIRLRDFFFLDQPIEVAADGAQRPFEGGVLYIDQGNIESRLRKYVGDSVAHRSCADDCDFLHAVISWQRLFWRLAFWRLSSSALPLFPPLSVPRLSAPPLPLPPLAPTGRRRFLSKW